VVFGDATRLPDATADLAGAEFSALVHASERPAHPAASPTGHAKLPRIAPGTDPVRAEAEARRPVDARRPVGDAFEASPTTPALARTVCATLRARGSARDPRVGRASPGRNDDAFDPVSAKVRLGRPPVNQKKCTLRCWGAGRPVPAPCLVPARATQRLSGPVSGQPSAACNPTRSTNSPRRGTGGGGSI
jgi:hypothetical protein